MRVQRAGRGHAYTMVRHPQAKAPPFHMMRFRSVINGLEIKASDQAKAVAIVMLVLPVPKVEGVRACCRRSDNFCP
jgi:hypothetical protein